MLDTRDRFRLAGIAFPIQLKVLLVQLQVSLLSVRLAVSQSKFVSSVSV